jgi:SAM-dependent methyltransferase
VSESDRERWDRRYAAGGAPEEPDPGLLELLDQLPAEGSAVDLAGGGGRHGLVLARRGLAVTVVDVSPAALAIARSRAEAAGLPLTTLEWDLEAQGRPPGSFRVALSFHYLFRPLLAEMPRLLEPGGVLVFCQPTRSNLARHPHPSARFLLADGELPSLLPPELVVLDYREGWVRDRHEAWLLARRG